MIQKQAMTEIMIHHNGCEFIVLDLHPLLATHSLNHTQLWAGVLHLDRWVAKTVMVKQLLPNYSQTNLAHLKQEVASLSQCQSIAIDDISLASGIPTLYASNLLPDTVFVDKNHPPQSLSPCIIMSYHSSRTLKSWIHANPNCLVLSFEQKIAIFLAICQLINRMHQLGVLHLDIKPSNIIVKPNLEVVLIDFGISQMVGKNNTVDHFEKRVTSGTPAYMSPEQLTGQNVDKHSDYYSLGILLYQLLMGYLPFNAKNHYGWAIAHCQSPVPYLVPTHQLSQLACQACQPLIDKLLAKRIHNRIDDLEKIINALKILLNQ